MRGMERIFISHSSANTAEATAIKAWMAEQGWDDVFLDTDPERGLKAGERWQLALKQAAERCELVIFLVSPEWAASKWCLAEFLLAKSLNKRIFAAIIAPVPLSDLPSEMTSEWQIVDLIDRTPAGPGALGPTAASSSKAVAFSSDGLRRLRAGLLEAGLDPKFFPWPPENDANRSPFRGLRSLDVDDAGIFFGRDGPIVEALDRLRGLREMAAPRLLVILGSSGSGKSSFMRAGLLPRLARDDRHFLSLPVVRPEQAAISGNSGLVRCILAAAAAAGLRWDRARVRDAVLAGPAGLRGILHELVSKVFIGGDRRTSRAPTIVLPIDQGEELFLAEGAVEAEQLLRIIRDLVSVDAPEVICLVTIRSDNYDRFQTVKVLEGIRQTTFSLPPLPQGAFSDVILGPARRLSDTPRRLEIEDQLVTRVLADIQDAGGKDALPLLAFTLERLYTEYGDSGSLRLAQYERLGGISGSIEAAVERAMQAAAKDHRVASGRTQRLALLRRAFIPALAVIDRNTKMPRRRVASISELPEPARPLIDHFVDQRLLATDTADRDGGERTIEAAHEALLRQWRLLRGWLDDDSDLLRHRENIIFAAQDWHENGGANDWLVHTGPRLTALAPFFAREDLSSHLDSGAVAYLQACRNRDRELTAQEQSQRRRYRRVRLAIAAILTLTTLFSLYQWNSAIIQQERTTLASSQVNFDKARQLRASGAETDMLLLLHEVRAAMKVSQIENVLRDIRLTLARWNKMGLPLPSFVEAGLARSRRTAEMREKVSGEIESAIYSSINSNKERAVLGTAHAGPVFALAASGDKSLLASGDQTGTVNVWTARNMQAAGPPSFSFSDQNMRIRSLDLCDAQQLLVAASDDGSATIWSTNTGKVVRRLTMPGADGKPLLGARFDGSCSHIAVASDTGQIAIWPLARASETKPRILAGHEERVNHLEFVKQGRYLVSASDDARLGVWNSATGERVRWLEWPAQRSIYQFAVDRSGTHLITASAEGLPQLWDIASDDPSNWKAMAPDGLPGHEGEVYDVQFSPDGRYAVSASEDETAIVWPIVDGVAREGMTLKGHTGIVHSARFSSDGRRVVTVSRDETVRIWDVATGAQITMLRGHVGDVYRALFGQHDHEIISTGADGTIRLWETDNAHEVLRLPPEQSSIRHERPIVQAEISPDGEFAVTSSVDGSAIAWNLTTLEGKRLGHKQAVWSSTFSPDGRRIATASDDRTAIIWDTATGSRLATLARHKDWVSSARFSRDGKSILTISGDRTAILWDAEKGEPRHVLESHTVFPKWGEFSPDGKLALTVAGTDVFAWDATTGEIVNSISFPTNLLIARATPDSKRVIAAGEDGRLYMWDLSKSSVQRFKGHHTASINYFAFDRSGHFIASASRDSVVRIWDLRTKALVSNLRGHSGYVSDVQFSPENNFLVTGAEDQTTRVWDWRSGIEIVRVAGHAGPVMSAGFVPGSQRLFSAARDKTLRFWNLSSSRKIFVPAYRRGELSGQPMNEPSGEDNSAIVAYRQMVDSPEALDRLIEELVPRCLTPNQSAELHLETKVARWCAGKWPMNRVSPNRFKRN